jgi:diguanylate cyclase (GGDEF)-like protein
VYNRRHFFSLAQNELNRAMRYNRELSIILFDIDHFKSVNDTFGHLVGDQVLETLSSYCKSNLRSFDIIGRYGGEEFIILLPETSLKRASQIAERLRKQALGIHITTPGGTPGITISLGVAGIRGGDQITLDELIGAADQALYKAKKAGRNQACVLYPRDELTLE